MVLQATGFQEKISNGCYGRSPSLSAGSDCETVGFCGIDRRLRRRGGDRTVMLLPAYRFDTILVEYDVH